MRAVIITLGVILVSLINVTGQQRTFIFKVNDSDYTINQERMNEYFGATFEQLIAKGICKKYDFPLWRDSYERFLDNAERGRYQLITYGQVYGGFYFSGDMTEYDVGKDENGKPAKGNPNKKDNKAARMRELNYYLPRFIIINEAHQRVDW